MVINVLLVTSAKPITVDNNVFYNLFFHIPLRNSIDFASALSAVVLYGGFSNDIEMQH